MSRVDPLSHRPKGTLGGLATRVIPRVFVPLVVVALLGTPIAMSRAEGTTIAYPPPSEETQSGLFIVRCPLSHRAQVDPIVNPGKPSHHLHEFFGNSSVASDSTYASMTAAGTTCGLSRDTAGYWVPPLLRPDGTMVDPVTAFSYYRNRPVNYGKTVPFPADFRMIAGGTGTFPTATFWNCFRDDSATVRYASPPLCRNDYLVANIFFPNCWDGVNLDSTNHRSHVVHPTGTGATSCPSSHPVKLPQLRFFVRYPKNSGGPGWKLSDGTTLPHADFWNTWQQPALEDLVRRCLNPGVVCR